MDFKTAAKEKLQDLASWLKPESPGSQSSTAANANALTERIGIDRLLNYRGLDYQNDLVMMDDSETLYCGFGFRVSSMIVGGRDLEDQLEGVINALPQDSIFMTAQWHSDDITEWMNDWRSARLKYCDNQLLKDMVEARYNYVMGARRDKSLLPNETFHPRNVQNYVFVKVPYTGSMESPFELDDWANQCRELRESVNGRLAGCGLHPVNMDGPAFKRLLRQLLNPQFETDNIDARESKNEEFPEDLVEREGRMHVNDGGHLVFSGGDQDVAVVPITIDYYPDTLYLPNLRSLIGNIAEREERINDPFWIWTAVHVPEPDIAREAITGKLGLINKQTLSESDWFRSMASHLFDRKAETEELLSSTRSRRQIVRAVSGINVYTRPERAANTAEAICNMWRKSGFQASIEKNIGLPIWLSSLPMQYNYKADQPTSGLMRMEMVHSLNAACMSHVAADWRGVHPSRGGPLFVSRRGQLAAFDLFSSDTNYNLATIATSGSGKSFVNNELVCDILARGGMVRIIDVGRSYFKLADVLGGQNLVFNANEPQSINPFSDIKDEATLAEMMPLLKETLSVMAYPRSEHSIPAWEYQFLEDAIYRCWHTYGEDLGLGHICDALNQHEDKRAQDLSWQLKPYGHGRYAVWFNGRKTLSFEGMMTVLELEELNQDQDFRAIILIISMNMIMRDIYLKNKSRPDGSFPPALLLIDEAWDLLGSDGGGESATAKFIETASRRIRKYGGSLVVISQAYGDLLKSGAAKAALDNSAWKFSLQQSQPSIKSARDSGALPPEDLALWKMLSTVKKGKFYSEIHVIDGSQCHDVYRFIVDPVSLYTFTTNPEDKAKIESYRTNYGMNYREAILASAGVLSVEEYEVAKAKNAQGATEQNEKYGEAIVSATGGKLKKLLTGNK